MNVEDLIKAEVCSAFKEIIPQFITDPVSEVTGRAIGGAMSVELHRRLKYAFTEVTTYLDESGFRVTLLVRLAENMNSAMKFEEQFIFDVKPMEVTLED